MLVRARALLDAARAASVPVFFTTIVYDEVGEAAAAVFLRKVAGAEGAAAGDALGRDRRAARAPRDEPVLVKAHASAFFGVPFAALLAGRDTLIVCGASTSGCVRATVVDAMQHGLVADRPARVRRRPLAARARAGARRHRRPLRRRRVARGGARGVTSEVIAAFADAADGRQRELAQAAVKNLHAFASRSG